MICTEQGDASGYNLLEMAPRLVQAFVQSAGTSPISSGKVGIRGVGSLMFDLHILVRHLAANRSLVEHNAPIIGSIDNTQLLWF